VKNREEENMRLLYNTFGGNIEALPEIIQPGKRIQIISGMVYYGKNKNQINTHTMQLIRMFKKQYTKYEEILVELFLM
jgi:hypothetical protein